jgi:hypothetical protein
MVVTGLQLSKILTSSIADYHEDNTLKSDRRAIVLLMMDSESPLDKMVSTFDSYILHNQFLIVTVICVLRTILRYVCGGCKHSG